MAASGFFGAIAALSGCTLKTEVGRDVLPLEQVARIPDRFRNELDLLVVVDDTRNMAQVQESTTAMWNRIRGHLAFFEGGFPAVRIGVVSSDLGVGAEALVAGCTSRGDDGALQPGGDGTLWLDVDAADLANSDFAFAERVALGESGCAFEQPLAAMQRALDRGQMQNAGFLRDNAALGVVFIAGDDDCSVDDPAFFTDGAEPLSKFRCFSEGVRCGGDDVYVGDQHDCVPQAKSEYLAEVDAQAAFLVDLKSDPSSLVVGGVIGAPEQVEVVESKTGLALSPACADAGTQTELYPGIRLGAFLGPAWQAATTRRGAVGDLCEESPGDTGGKIGVDLRRALGHRCLEGAIIDVRPDDPGLQHACEVHVIDAAGVRTDLEACDNPDHIYDYDDPCYAIMPGPAQCGDFPSQLALGVNWGGADKQTTPAGVTTFVECLVEGDGVVD